MADGSKAAVFALNNFFTDIFKSKAKEHKDKIDQFNIALIDLAQRKAEKIKGKSLQPSSNDHCAVCQGNLTKYNSKPVPCINLDCSSTMHTKCFRKHRCITSSGKRPIEMTSFLVSDEEPNQDDEYLCPQQEESSSIESPRSSSTLPSLAYMAPIDFSANSLSPTTSSDTCPMSQALSTSQPAGISNFTVVPSTRQAPALSNNGTKPKKTKENNPHLVKIELLEKELIIAQTKISALENDLRRKDDTIKIQEERIKSLEHPTIKSLFDKYIHPNSASNPKETNDDPNALKDSIHPLLQHILNEIETLTTQVSSLSDSVSSMQHDRETAAADISIPSNQQPNNDDDVILVTETNHSQPSPHQSPAQETSTEEV